MLRLRLGLVLWLWERTTAESALVLRVLPSSGTSCSRMFNFRLPLISLCHFDFLICLVAFCIHLPLHFIYQRCITLSGNKHAPSLYMRPNPFHLASAAPAAARQIICWQNQKFYAFKLGASGKWAC